MSSGLVTVVITTYRRPKYLPEAIDSVLKQTYKNIELIVVDDNSEGTPDQLATAEAAARFDDPRLRYHALKHNAGASSARNAGITLANGAYVAFLDDDDIILPEKIEKQVLYLEAHDDSYGGCGTWLTRFYENGAEFDFKPPDGIDVFLAGIKREQTYQTSTFLFRRSALLDIGMFDTSFRLLEDPELIIRLSLSYRYGIVEEILTRVRSRKETADADRDEYWNLKLLAKFKDEISKLPPREKRRVYFTHYFSLSKKFLQNRKFKKAFSYFLRCRNPLKYIYEFCRSSAAFVRRNRAINRIM